MPITTHWLHLDSPACQPDGLKDGKILTRTPALITCEACRRVWMITEQTGEPDPTPGVQAFYHDPYMPCDDKTVVVNYEFPPQILEAMKELGVGLADLEPHKANPDTLRAWTPAGEPLQFTPDKAAKANIPLIQAGFEGFYLFPPDSEEDQEQRRLEKEYLTQLEGKETLREIVDKFIEAVGGMLNIDEDQEPKPAPAVFYRLPKPQPQKPAPPYQFGVERQRFDPSKRGRRG